MVSTDQLNPVSHWTFCSCFFFCWIFGDPNAPKTPALIWWIFFPAEKWCIQWSWFDVFVEFDPHLGKAWWRWGWSVLCRVSFYFSCHICHIIYHSPLHHHNTIHTKRTYMNIHEHTWTYIPPNLDHTSAYSGSLNYPCFFHFQLDRCKTTTLHEGLDPGAMFNSPVMKVGTTRSPCQICKALEVKSAKFWLYFGTGTSSCCRCNLFKSRIG